MNIATFVGTVHKLEFKYTQQGKLIANFTVRVYEGKDNVTFVNAVAFGQTAEFIQKYFVEKAGIAINARYQQRKYQASDGTNRTSHDFVVSNVAFLPRVSEPAAPEPAGPDYEGDAPF